eukprot:4834251-Amphidinium_carterae.1
MATIDEVDAETVSSVYAPNAVLGPRCARTGPLMAKRPGSALFQVGDVTLDAKDVREQARTAIGHQRQIQWVFDLIKQLCGIVLAPKWDCLQCVCLEPNQNNHAVQMLTGSF